MMKGWGVRLIVLVGLAFGWGSAAARAQENLDAGKSPAQLFATDCALCHKSANGLSKGGGLFGLTGFLREHYTASRETAAALAAYLQQVDVSKPAEKPRQARRPRPDSKPKADDKKPEEAKTPAEGKPAESAPAETKPSEAKPVEAKPADTKPGDSKPAEAKDAQSVSAQAAGGPATDSKASADKPADTKSDKKE